MGAWLMRGLLIGAGLALAALAVADHPAFGGGPGFGIFQAAVLAAGAATALAGLAPRRLLAPLLLAVVSVAVSLAVAEVAARALVGPRYQTAYAFDERALFRLRPGAAREYAHLPENGGGTLVYRVNADGFRGPELLPAGSRPRVLVYGDSFIHAEFSPLEETFAARLQDALAARLGREVEVVNAGVAGYGPDQILRRMEADLDRLAPDLVLVSVFSGNDFGDLLRNRLYRLGPDGGLVENAWTLSPEQRRSIATDRDELMLVRLARDALSRLRGGGGPPPAFDPEGWIEAALRQHLDEYRAYVEEGDSTVGTFAVDPYSADIAFDPEAPSAVYKLELMAAVLRRIAAEAGARGIPLRLLIVPHPMDLLDGAHASGVVDRAKHPGYDPRRLTAALTAIAERAGIGHIDLYDAFRASDPAALYLKGGDDHWNAAGQKLAAEITAEALAREGALGGE